MDDPRTGSVEPLKQIKYWIDIDPNQSAGLLSAVARELAGSAFISLEGYMSECEPLTLPGLTTAETELLRRKTITPLLDFVVIPLEITTVDQTLERILSDPCLMDAVVHIEIAKDGQIEFAAYDHFSPTFCGAGVPRGLLDGLVQSGVVKMIKAV
jgi:hypothetical protein